MRIRGSVLWVTLASVFMTTSIVAQPFPALPGSAGTEAAPEAQPATNARPGMGSPRLTGNAVVDGTHGDVDLTSPAPFTATGVLLQSKASWPYIVLRTGTVGTGSGVVMYDAANTPLFAVIGDGSVGVRTSSPGAPLDVNLGTIGGNVREVARFGSTDSGSVIGGGAFISLGNSALARIGEITTISQGNLFFSTYNGGNAPAERMRLTGDGRLGIGTQTPASRLSVQQSIDPAPGADGADAARVYNSAGSSFLQLQVNASGAELSSSGTTLLPLYLNTARLATPPVSILVNGNVGIGTTTPTKKLEVNGDLHVNGVITGVRVINATFQDIAEWVPAEEPLEPGMVVVIGTGNSVRAAAEAYDTRVAGVVSPQPGLVLGVEGPSKVMVATTGRVKVRVDATKTPIREGDLLVSSGEPGIAMRSEPMEINGRRFHQPGTLIGKALQSLAGGKGEILVLLSMQ